MLRQSAGEVTSPRVLCIMAGAWEWGLSQNIDLRKSLSSPSQSIVLKLYRKGKRGRVQLDMGLLNICSMLGTDTLWTQWVTNGPRPQSARRLTASKPKTIFQVLAGTLVSVTEEQQ